MTLEKRRFTLPDGPRPVVDWTAAWPASLLENLKLTAAVAGAQPLVRVLAALDALGPALLAVVLPKGPFTRSVAVAHSTESGGLFTFPVEDHHVTQEQGSARWVLHLHRMYNGHLGGWEETLNATLGAPSGTLVLAASHWSLVPDVTLNATQLDPSLEGTLLDLLVTTLGLVPRE